MEVFGFDLGKPLRSGEYITVILEMDVCVDLRYRLGNRLPTERDHLTLRLLRGSSKLKNVSTGFEIEGHPITHDYYRLHATQINTHLITIRAIGKKYRKGPLVVMTIVKRKHCLELKHE